MEFIRARTQEQIINRQEEIIHACDVLFSQSGYDGVNFKAISKMTSFTRPSIYNYYQTKDEILLDLLKQEMLHWQADFLDIMNSTSSMTKEQYSISITKSLQAHDKMLKLLSILFIFLEKNSRIEKIADFKKTVFYIFGTINESVNKYFPNASKKAKDTFTSVLFPYILGLHPMTYLSEKQLRAVQLAGVDYTVPDFQYMCYHGILLLLSDL